MSHNARIVAAYDGSPTARAALRTALERAGAEGEVVVVHAFEPPHDWLGHPNYERTLEERRSKAQEMLDGLPADLDVETELIAGPPAETIARVAAVRDADEIVIGSHGHGRLRSALGSTSQDVLHLADRPVVVVPAKAVA